MDNLMNIFKTVTNFVKNLQISKKKVSTLTALKISNTGLKMFEKLKQLLTFKKLEF